MTRRGGKDALERRGIKGDEREPKDGATSRLSERKNLSPTSKASR